MYLDFQIRMQQELKLEALFALVAHVYDRLQAVLRQCHAVDEAEIERPCCARLLRQPGPVQAEVELD